MNAYDELVEKLLERVPWHPLLQEHDLMGQAWDFRGDKAQWVRATVCRLTNLSAREWSEKLPADRLLWIAAAIKQFDEQTAKAAEAAAVPVSAVEPIHEPIPEPVVPVLSIDIDKLQVTFKGEQLDVSSKNALRWLKVLADRPGDWVSGSDLVKFDAELDGARPDRLKKMLPASIQSLIDSETGKGSRLVLPSVAKP